MKIVNNKTKKILLRVIKKSILPFTKIHTDGLKSYSDIDKIPNRFYTHVMINHSIGFTNTEGEHTNNIESLWGKLKKTILFTSGPYELQLKVDEFIVRYYLKLQNVCFFHTIINEAFLTQIKFK